MIGRHFKGAGMKRLWLSWYLPETGKNYENNHWIASLEVKIGTRNSQI
jgi:hypothetical protein